MARGECSISGTLYTDGENVRFVGEMGEEVEVALYEGDDALEQLIAGLLRQRAAKIDNAGLAVLNRVANKRREATADR
jgi:hypothetical protein